MLSPKKPTRINIRLAKAARLLLHLVCILWLSIVFYDGVNDQLGGDPVQALLDFTGIASLNLLVMSLLITPLATHFKFAQLMAFRRPIGLYAAVYALCHFFVFVAFELQFELALVVSEIIERPYITVGFVALIILISLTITSLSPIKKSMGTRWFTLHSLVYVAILLAGLHFLWLVKSSWYEPAIYLCISGVLVTMRRKKIKKIFK